MTRAVLFDVDGVILDGYHARPDGLKRWDQFLAADLGIDPVVFNEKFIKPLYVPFVLNRQKSLVNALEEAMPDLGYDGSPMHIIAAWMNRDTGLNEPLLEVIDTLRSSGAARAYIASNQEDVRAQNLWTHLGLGLHFEDIFYSARLGAAKPDPAFFAAVDRHLGPQAEPPLFFDDYTSVAAAATAHGWEGVVYDTVEDCRTHPWIAAQLKAAAATRRPSPVDDVGLDTGG
jgi:putative hydrolase of the HAD superfamily